MSETYGSFDLLSK